MGVDVGAGVCPTCTHRFMGHIHTLTYTHKHIHIHSVEGQLAMLLDRVGGVAALEMAEQVHTHACTYT